jgi:hypothetical protein
MPGYRIIRVRLQKASPLKDNRIVAKSRPVHFGFDSVNYFVSTNRKISE